MQVKYKPQALKALLKERLGYYEAIIEEYNKEHAKEEEEAVAEFDDWVRGYEVQAKREAAENEAYKTVEILNEELDKKGKLNLPDVKETPPRELVLASEVYYATRVDVRWSPKYRPHTGFFERVKVEKVGTWYFELFKKTPFDKETMEKVATLKALLEKVTGLEEIIILEGPEIDALASEVVDA